MKNTLNEDYTCTVRARLLCGLALALLSILLVVTMAMSVFWKPQGVPVYVGTLGDCYGEGDETDMVTRSDFYVPNVPKKFGLFIYDGGEWRDAFSATTAFDETKPTLFYSHGMGGGSGLYNARGWVDDGYNVLTFFWGSYSDDDPMSGQSKLWGVNPQYMRWLKEDDTFETVDLPTCSVGEYYAASYCDFLSMHSGYDREIRLLGHSLGGQISLCLTSYLLHALMGGNLNPSFIPDRVTLLDPYLCDVSDTTYCKWISGTLEGGGSCRLAYETAQLALYFGVPIEHLRSSPYVKMASSLGKTDYNDRYAELVMYTELDTSFMLSRYNVVTAIEKCHVYSIDWYDYVRQRGEITDSAGTLSAPPCLSAEVDCRYSFARMGARYLVCAISAEDSAELDTITSQNVTSAKICGYAFSDANGDGVMNERLSSRFSGVTVSLYDGDTLVESVRTEINGYYCFNAAAQKEYTVRFDAPSGYTLKIEGSGRQSDTAARSSAVTLSDEVDLVMLNVAVTAASNG